MCNVVIADSDLNKAQNITMVEVIFNAHLPANYCIIFDYMGDLFYFVWAFCYKLVSTLRTLMGLFRNSSESFLKKIQKM